MENINVRLQTLKLRARDLARFVTMRFASVWFGLVATATIRGVVSTICKGLPCLPQNSSSSANVNDVSILSHIINISLVVREQFACTIWSAIEERMCECESIKLCWDQNPHWLYHHLDEWDRKRTHKPMWAASRTRNCTVYVQGKWLNPHRQHSTMSHRFQAPHFRTLLHLGLTTWLWWVHLFFIHKNPKHLSFLHYAIASTLAKVSVNRSKMFDSSQNNRLTRKYQ